MVSRRSMTSCLRGAAISEHLSSCIASSSRQSVRSIATSKISLASVSIQLNSKAIKTYPFAPDAVTRATPLDLLKTNANTSPKSTARGVMATLEAQLRSERDPTLKFTSLFSRNSKDRIPPGSVLLVETYTDASKTSFTSSSGILIAIRRRGLSTSFILRNIILKLGVETRFNLFSPLLKDIKVVQKAVVGKDKKGTGLQRARRAKLYYLRHDDRKLAGIGKSVAALRAKEEAKKVASKAGRKPVIKDRR